jgi:hypothetical protein
MFYNKVMLRNDCHHAFWKERFISGLPPLFAEKVRQKLKQEFGNTIPYDTLSYGQLVTYINIVRSELCTDLKLENQVAIFD